MNLRGDDTWTIIRITCYRSRIKRFQAYVVAEMTFIARERRVCWGRGGEMHRVPWTISCYVAYLSATMDITFIVVRFDLEPASALKFFIGGMLHLKKQHIKQKMAL